MNSRGRGKNRKRGNGRKNFGRNITTQQVKIGRIGRVVPLRFQFQPPRIENVIRYNTTKTSTLTSQQTVDQVFRLSNVWDPDHSGIGRVGYGYEEFSRLYKRVMVTKVKWTLECPCTNDTLYYCVVPTNDQTSFTDIHFSGQLPFSKIGTTGFNGTPPFKDMRTRNLITLSGSTFEQFICDDSFVEFIEFDTTLTIDTNPKSQYFLHIVTANPTSQTHTRVFIITLEYTCIWSDPKNPVPTTKEEMEIKKKLESKVLDQSIEIEQLKQLLIDTTISTTSESNDEI